MAPRREIRLPRTARRKAPPHPGLPPGPSHNSSSLTPEGEGRPQACSAASDRNGVIYAAPAASTVVTNKDTNSRNPKASTPTKEAR